MLTQKWPMIKESGRCGRPGSRLITHRTVDRATKKDNFVQTCKMRHKLDDVQIKQVDSKWFCVARSGELLSSHEDVGSAVAALSELCSQ